MHKTNYMHEICSFTINCVILWNNIEFLQTFLCMHAYVWQNTIYCSWLVYIKVTISLSLSCFEHMDELEQLKYCYFWLRASSLNCSQLRSTLFTFKEDYDRFRFHILWLLHEHRLHILRPSLGCFVSRKCKLRNLLTRKTFFLEFL